MDKTLDSILKKFNLSVDQQTAMPLAIPNFGRFQLAELLKEFNFKRAVEIGVAAGDYSKALCEANPDMEVFGIDPYVPYRGYRDYARQSTFEKLQTNAESLLKDCPNYHFVKKFSMDALVDFDDDSLDFVYLDGNHQEPYISQDIEGWYKKLKPAGILAGHDYFKSKHHPQIQVLDAINKFTEENRIRPWFVLGSDARVKGSIRDVPRSWMLVKL